MSVKLLKENYKQDRAVWDSILKSVVGDLATGPISQDYGLGHRIVDISPDDETINKVAGRAKSAGFKEVHRQVEDDPRSDSYVVFTRESEGRRVVLGIVFNASENFAYVDCGYDPNSPDDAEWFGESLNEGNPVGDLPLSLDQFLQDLAQVHGYIDYSDIADFNPDESQIKELKKLRRKYNEEAEYCDEDAETACDLIARDVANIVTHAPRNESADRSDLVKKSTVTLKKMLKTATPEESKKIWAELNCRGVYAKDKDPGKRSLDEEHPPVTRRDRNQGTITARDVKIYHDVEDLARRCGCEITPTARDTYDITGKGVDVYNMLYQAGYKDEDEIAELMGTYLESLNEDLSKEDIVFILKKLRTEASDALYNYEQKDSLVECRDSLYYLVNDARSALDQVNLMIKDQKLDSLFEMTSKEAADSLEKIISGAYTTLSDLDSLVRKSSNDSSIKMSKKEILSLIQELRFAVKSMSVTVKGYRVRD